jgi:glycerol-3-phosphate dehydrogenase (NAD(P)+)
MKDLKRFAIIGNGSWATALAKIILQNEKSINWFISKQDDIRYFKKFKHNPRYLSSIDFETEKIVFYHDIKEVILQSDVLIFAIPAPFLKETLSPVASLEGKFIVSAIKGIIPQDNMTVAEFFNVYYKIPFGSIGIISGPSHAEEIALERLTYLTVATKNIEIAHIIADRFKCHYIKTNVVSDIYGIEYSGVLKNIVAIAVGISHGLGYGDNFNAVLVSNAIREIKRFLDETYKHKKIRRINTSPYLGDLLVTAYSQFSRNRMFGAMIGKGYSVKSAQMEMTMIAEGYYAVKCIKELNNKFKVKMPIMDAVYNILYEKISPAIEINILADKLH